MTDGGIHILDDGQQIVKFHIRDGMGVRLWREAGKRFGIVTGRKLESIRRRAADLWLDIVRLGIDDKLPAVDAAGGRIRTHARAGLLHRRRFAGSGDDSGGRAWAWRWPTRSKTCATRRSTSRAFRGGQAPVREVVELILKNTGRWDDVLKRYGGVN